MALIFFFKSNSFLVDPMYTLVSFIYLVMDFLDHIKDSCMHLTSIYTYSTNISHFVLHEPVLSEDNLVAF
jgi:hypothetical protein